MAWTDIEVLRTANGSPTVSLHNEARLVADRLGVSRWLLSISHSETVAIASAIAIVE